ncbi:MYXO-CTERM domain-containing protein/PGF-CTERM protein [Halohasta litchfieldiae]|jgi:PGF-CTERM protein|uniref:MYXO-CTERM domain-containing protein/PGF-CTERM protein n=2 Tax=Halohasta litchfieldiae TaxID=1073996 RepID=A0A1H6X8Q6_9EURY|nr:MYXO-CTERM domain-containing protein/PGF-CTERM protein [Halohasta litchfieldiae]SEJ20955.1 MYXO-CTERM domain-containing protein/PGF-CTERM protein [Halohasta litchfieldiae]
MNSTRYTAVLSGFVALLMITSLFAPVAYAQSQQDDTQSEDDSISYRIVQGDQEVSVEPIEGDVPVEEFYDYRYPYQSRDNLSWGRAFSSQGTTQYQQEDTSILMLYEGPNGVSLVAVHDKYYENAENGTPGSSVSWEITGLPDDGEWAVIDDDYDWRNETTEKDDIHQLAEDHQAGAAGNDGEPPEDVDARLSWVWTTGRNDGMAYRGLGQDDVSITIDPAFNEESYHRYGDTRRPDEDPDDPTEGPEYNGTIDDWQVITATDDGDDFRRVWFDSLEQDVTIETVDEPPEPTVSVAGPETATVGEEVTFNTSNTTDNVESYEWTVNGTTVESTNESTLTHPFNETGTAEVEVTVSTADDQTATNSTTVEVVESEGTSTGQTPGFGPILALVALVAAMLFAVRRSNT